MSFEGYEPGDFFDEFFLAEGKPRPATQALIKTFNTLSFKELIGRRDAAQQLAMRQGVTFTVYGDGEGTERILPFDVIPRVVPESEWSKLEAGLKQRVYALNLFLADIYGDQNIIKDGIIPRELIESATGFLSPCLGLKPHRNIWCQITGTDLVRDQQGNWYVLEDNVRCPSGASYVLNNRYLMKLIFPRLFHQMNIQAVDRYPSHLLETLRYIAPDTVEDPTIAVLTPGRFNSAYFEHSYLAQQMGVKLVEGQDLLVSDGELKMRTTKGLQRVDVLYRRIDDVFLDPTVFRADSLLGIPGIIDVYRQGRLGLANAPGTGVADDKVIYAYVPDIIRYYLNESPKLANVPTYLCWEPKQQEYVLNNLDKLVVKAADESGGYGMLVGPHASPSEREEFGTRIKAHPRKYIAQPTLCLSRVPTLLGDEASCQVEGCHVDLRPYVLYGEDIHVNPGGLTRVAMRRGSSAGTVWMPLAQRAVEQAEEAIQHTQQALAGQTGILKIGINTSIANSQLPNILTRFRRSFAQVTLEMHELPSYQQFEKLQQSNLDIGFFHLHSLQGFDPDYASRFSTVLVLQEPLLVVLPASHRLAKCSSIELEAIAKERFILPPSSLLSGYRLYVEQLCQHSGFRPHVSQEAAWISTTLGLVAGKMGISLLPANARNLQRSGVRYVKLKGDESSLELVAVYLSSNQSPALANFAASLLLSCQSE